MKELQKVEAQHYTDRTGGNQASVFNVGKGGWKQDPVIPRPNGNR